MSLQPNVDEPDDTEMMDNALRTMLDALGELPRECDVDVLAMTVMVWLRMRNPGDTTHAIRRFCYHVRGAYARRRDVILRMIEWYLEYRNSPPLTEEGSRQFVREVVAINEPNGQEELDCALDQALEHVRLQKESLENDLAETRKSLAACLIAEQELVALRPLPSKS